MNQTCLLTNAVLWATAIVVAAVVGAPIFLSLILLPSLAAIAFWRLFPVTQPSEMLPTVGAAAALGMSWVFPRPDRFVRAPLAAPKRRPPARLPPRTRR